MQTFSLKLICRFRKKRIYFSNKKIAYSHSYKRVYLLQENEVCSDRRPLHFLWYLPSAATKSVQLRILLFIETTCWSLGSFSRRSLQSLRIVSCDPSVSALHHSFVLSGCRSSLPHFSEQIKQWVLKSNVTILSHCKVGLGYSGTSLCDLLFTDFTLLQIFFWQDEWIYAGVGSKVLSSLILLKYWLRSFLPKMLQLDIKFVSPFVTNDSCSCRYWLQITYKLLLIFILTWKMSKYPIKFCISSEDWKYVSS